MDPFGLELSDSEGEENKTPVKVKGPKSVFPIFSSKAGGKKRVGHSENTPPAKTPKPALRKSRINRDDSQQILDAGQKEFGPVKCGLCGMFYEPKHGEDVDKHAAFHAQHLAKFKEAEDRKHKVTRSPLVRSLDLSCAKLTETMYRVWSNHLLHTIVDHARGKVVRVKEEDEVGDKETAALHRLHQRLDKLGSAMNQELGYTAESGQDLWKPGKAAAKRSLYLFLSVGLAPTIIGMAVVDFPLPGGARLILKPQEPAELGSETGDHNASTSSNWSGSGSLCVSDDVAYKVEFGIHRIWVHPSYRRKGTARRLLDGVRYAQGRRTGHNGGVPKKRMAFTEPTGDGMKLMDYYCGGLENVLIYDPTAAPPHPVLAPAQPLRVSSPKPLGDINPRLINIH